MFYPHKCPPFAVNINNQVQLKSHSMQGKVKFFNESKDWGFIEMNDGGKGIFVHKSGINIDNGFPCLSEGDVVEFEIGEGHKGPTATNVRKVSQ